MSLVKQSLQISSVGVEDGGDYICNVETVGKPLDQVHTLDVLGKCWISVNICGELKKVTTSTAHCVMDAYSVHI